MRIGEIARLVFLNILENKFKVVLTSIGIIVGAATIVLVIAVGRGGEMDVADQFKNLNAASIEITTSSSSTSSGAMSFGGGGGGMPGGGAMPSGGGGGGGMPSGGGGNAQGGGMGGGFPGGNFSFGMPNLATVNATLTEDDAEDIAFFIPNVADATISANGSKAVLGGNLEEEGNYTVAAVKPDYLSVSNLSLYLGDFISEDDEENKVKNCVIGYKLASTLYDSPIDAYDTVITIEGTSFVVVGVLQEMGTVSSGISPDEAIYIPYSTGSKYVFGRELSPQITVVADSLDDVEGVIENINILLGENYPGATFTISDAGSKIEAALASSNTLTMLLFAVALIVFVVGGIGIMNVMFVSVKERTKEIGVLKALGMQRPHVLLEFLMEAVVISIIGGGLGILLSLILIPLAEQFGVRMEPISTGYVAAFGFAVVCGTLFGFYPALKASKLIPVEALTQD